MILQKLKLWFSGRTEPQLGSPQIVPWDNLRQVVLVYNWNPQTELFASQLRDQFSALGKEVHAICRFTGKDKDLPTTKSIIWSHKLGLNEFFTQHGALKTAVQNAQLIVGLDEVPSPAWNQLLDIGTGSLVVGYGTNTMYHVHLGNHSKHDFTINWNHLVKTYHFLTHSPITA